MLVDGSARPSVLCEKGYLGPTIRGTALIPLQPFIQGRFGTSSWAAFLQQLPEETRDIYERLIVKTRTALRAGQSVLVDATFAAAAERSAVAAVATEADVAFVGLFLDAPLATRLERIGSRRADASDADADVARRQTAERLDEDGWAAIAASGSLSDTKALARSRLDG